MNGLDVKWFKHSVNMTNDEKLKALYELYGEKGFSCILMWSRILEKAAQDSGYFRVTTDLAYDDITLKVAFPEVNRFYGIDFIKEILDYFVKMKMLTPDIFGVYQVTNWEKYQGTILSTPRVQKFRENKEVEDKITEVIVFFNQATGKNYSIKTLTHRSHIRARIDDGYTLEQMKAVILHKHRDWSMDAKMKKFVTPETLFSPGHFDRYLNEIPQNEQEAVATGKMLTVIDANGVRNMITQDQYDRAEKGYFKIVK